MKPYVLGILLCIFCCSQKQKQKPSFIVFETKNGNTIVYAENKLACPTHLIYKDLIKNQEQTIDLNPYQKKKVFTTLADTLTILNNSNFRMLYGISTLLKKYDTLYNYTLPFLKGKRYKILQGKNTNFTHNSKISKYAIDFKMNVGQTV